MATTGTAAPAAVLDVEKPVEAPAAASGITDSAAPAAALDVERTVGAPGAALDVEKAAGAPAAALDVEKAVEAPADATLTNKLSEDQLFAVADVVLRFLLFAAALVAVVVLATGKQTKSASPTAKFQHSPPLIYFIAAFSVAGLYSIITYLLSLYALLIKPGFCPQILSQFVIFDVILLGIVASATGEAGTVGYISLKGDSHVGWKKICSTYDVFCKHVGAAAGVSIFACVVLAALVLFSIFSLLKKVPK